MTSVGWLSAVVAAGVGVALGGSAAETISISARPSVVRWSESVVVTGALSSGRSDVDVVLQGRACHEGPWAVVSGTHTDVGGSLYLEFTPGISQTIRAVAGDATSNLLEVQQRPAVQLRQRPPGTFVVSVNAQRQFWHRKVVLQRFDAKKRNWVDIRSVLLTETAARSGSTYVLSGTEKFRQQVPKGTLLRATLPLSQAKPCYLAGYSNLLRR